MLLPDNIHPDNSVYYNGAIVLKILQEYKKVELLE
ncbi:TPA: ABC-three component system middle component 6, partial [Vibrio cholerae]